MAENIQGSIELNIKMGAGESAGAEGGEATAGKSTADPSKAKATPEQKKQSNLLNSMKQISTKMLPMVGLVSLGIKAIMGSAIFSSVFGALMDILSAMVDMLLMPLIPVLLPVLNVLAEMIPLIGEIAELLLGPMLDQFVLLYTLLEPFMKFGLQALTALLEGLNIIRDNILQPLFDVVSYAADWWENVLGKNIQEIKTFWTERFPEWVRDLPGNIAKAIRDFFSGMFSFGEGGGGVIGGLKKVFGVQKGIDYVPKDMLAMVHKGERILTPTESIAPSTSSIIFNSPIIGSVQVTSNASLEDVSRIISKRVIDEITSATRNKQIMV